MDFREFLRDAGAEAGLKNVLSGIAGVLPKVAAALERQAGSVAGSKNVFGEEQLEIDLAANRMFLEFLEDCQDVASIASEEMEEEGKGKGGEGAFSVAFDPLDGSSLVDVNLAVGSIVGVYRGAGFIGKKGSEQAAAMIAVYGPRLTFMISLGKGVFEFVYDKSANDFLLAGEVKMKGDKKIFAPGNLRACVSEAWYLQMLAYWARNGYTLRYSGGMVPDVNQILKKGSGIFAYPGYKEKPEGKLRLLYECAPAAFLMEQAGGSAIQGREDRILNLTIKALDQRTPVFLGSQKEIRLLMSFIKKFSG